MQNVCLGEMWDVIPGSGSGGVVRGRWFEIVLCAWFAGWTRHVERSRGYLRRKANVGTVCRLCFRVMLVRLASVFEAGIVWLGVV
jgi:hypothetical protein